MFAKSLFFLALFCVSFAGNFTIAQDSYLLNGKPIQLMSAAFHYFRVHPDRWEDTFKKLANAGMNTVETYIAWNMHEPERGQFNFEGANDLDPNLTLAEKYGILVIVRPGPYICAEWEFGGLPYWLLKEDGIKIRTKDPKYMEPVTQWMNTLLPVLSPHMIMNGGSIIMVQIENEYGSYPACDKEYLTELYDLTVANLGPATQYVTFTTDGPSDGMLTCGRLAGKAYSTVDFGPGNAHNPFATMRKYEPVGPYQNSEFYPGWLDHWKEKHQRTGAEPILKTMTEMYEMDANWNFYVFIGGTNWGFMSGANGGGKSFQPQPTSYDYDAPLSEAGDRTAKYYAIRDKIAEWKTLPQYEVADSEKKSFGEVAFTEMASLWDVLDVLDAHLRFQPQLHQKQNALFARAASAAQRALVAALGGLTATAAVEHDCYLLLAALIRPLRGCYSAQFEASPEGLEQRMQRVMALVAERRPAVPDTFAVAARGRPEA